MILRDLIRSLGSAGTRGRNLTTEEAFRAFQAICSGTESEIQVGAFLMALRWKGVTVEEVTAFARAARSMATLPCQGMSDLVCICPPHEGVDERPPLDVAAGLISAAAGARVLIISDRAVPPKRGLTAASVLEALGLSMTWDPSEAEDWVAKGRFAALSAAGMLPALMSLRRVRGELGVRTPISTVEKLVAPAEASIVIGAQRGPVLGLAVEVLQSLGHPRGIAVQGPEGDVTPAVSRRTRGIELTRTHQVPLTVDPGDFGLASDREPELPLFSPPEEGLGSGDNRALVDTAGDMTRAILAGELGAARNAALLTAAIVLKSAGISLTVADGVSAATEALDSGEATRVVEHLRTIVR